MKFKYLIVLFSIIIVFIIFIAVLYPVFFSNFEFAAHLRLLTVPLFLFILLLIICMTVFLLLNYRLFSLLEREDWPAVAYYLENKIYTKNRYTVRNVRLLAGSYLITLDYDSVFNLESRTVHHKPYIIDKNALVFGSAKILGGKNKEAVEFFRIHLEKGKKTEKQWKRWFYGFSLLLCGAFNRAEQEFSFLASTSKNALVCGLSAYFLDAFIVNHSKNPDDCKIIIETCRARILKIIGKNARWIKEAEKMGTDIHVAIIRKYIDEAGKWLFND